MTSSNGNIFRVTGPLCGEFTGPGEFPTQRPVTRSFDVYFDLRLNKRLSKQSWGWWFETLSRSLWRHRNALKIICYVVAAKTSANTLTHWGRVTHICVSKLTIIGSDNGLSLGLRQAIIWTHDGILLIGPIGTNSSDNLIEIPQFHSRKCIWTYRLKNACHFVLASLC